LYTVEFVNAPERSCMAGGSLCQARPVFLEGERLTQNCGLRIAELGTEVSRPQCHARIRCVSAIIKRCLNIVNVSHRCTSP
jgi:hypothetical protein